MIGGDFPIGKELINANIQEKDFQKLFGKKNFVLTDTGRSALGLALLEIKNKYSIQSAWLPIFSCQSIASTFLHCGYKINYYGMGSKLDKPNGLPKDLNNSVIFIIHYFGLKNKPLISYIKEHRNTNESFIVIEDLVQTCLSNQFGKYGDYSIHSLRKFLPVVDGGVLVSGKRIAYNFEESNEKFVSKKLFSKLLREFTDYDGAYLKLEKESERIIDNKIIPRKMSTFTKLLLQRINILDIQIRRINNWNTFNIKLKDLKVRGIERIFSKINDGEVPLGFPIVVNKKRNEFRKYLSDNRIHCPVHWNLINKATMKYKEDLQLSKNILTIPIDQRVNIAGIDKIISTISRFKF